MSIIFTVAAVLAPITASTMLLPQITSAWKIRNDNEALKGISIPTQLFMLANSILWLVFGIGLGEVSVYVASLFGIPTIAFTLAIVARAKMAQRAKNAKVEALNEVVGV